MINTSSETPLWKARAPKGWGPVEQVCRIVYEDLDAVTLRINGMIARTIPAFAPAESPFTDEDRFRSTRGMTAGFLWAVAENRDLGDKELAFARLIGQQSALKGFSLPPLIESLYSAYRGVWAELVAVADRTSGSAGEQLREAGATIWERMHGLTTAVTAGYHHQMPRPEALEIRIASQFVKAITAEPDSDESRALAIDLGFNADGTFRVAMLAEPAASVEAARTIAAEARRAGAVAVVAPRGGTSILIAQGLEDGALTGMVTKHAQGAPAGIGLPADGIERIGDALANAECGLRLAEATGGTRRFADEWFLAAPMLMRRGLEPMLATAIDVARRKPHLADAVRAFSSNGFSLAAASGELGVTQSTVRYRMKRWQAMTRCDPWSFAGLAESMLALELSRAPR